MKLGIVQTDPSDPDSLQIVNQESGEQVDNVSWCEMEYDICGTQIIKAEFKVFRKAKVDIPKINIEKLTSDFMKDVYKTSEPLDDLKERIQTSPNPFDQAAEHITHHHPV